ncbi:MAG: oxygenase MpaB family protein [Ilumatobacteraceae bacterium]
MNPQSVDADDAGAASDPNPISPEPAEAVRAWLADRIRGRIVGEDAETRQVELFEAPGERWFAADSAVVRVHADAAMFIGGLRALLIQSIHPLAMAGVAEHSDYRADPWGRLQRTADFLAATTFGPADQAEQAVAMVNRIHERVKGTAPDGREYSARDPRLLLWVHATEVDSFLAAHDRYGERPLDPAGRDEYVAQMSRVASGLGVIDPPTSIAELDEVLRSFRSELASTEASREATRYLLLEPPLPLSSRPAYGLLAASAVGLLPLWARRHLLIPYLPVTERLAVRPAGELITRTIRWALRNDRPYAAAH